MRPSARRSDDSDVIRARLRALLAEGQARGGWVPDEDPPRDDWADDCDDDDLVTTVPAAADAATGLVLPEGLGRHRAPGRTARLDPGRPGAWALWAVAVVAAAVMVGWTWLGRPAVEPVPAAVTAVASPSGSPEPDDRDGARDAAPVAGASGTVVVSVVGLVV